MVAGHWAATSPVGLDGDQGRTWVGPCRAWGKRWSAIRAGVLLDHGGIGRGCGLPPCVGGCIQGGGGQRVDRWPLPQRKVLPDQGARWDGDSTSDSAKALKSFGFLAFQRHLPNGAPAIRALKLHHALAGRPRAFGLAFWCPGRAPLPPCPPVPHYTEAGISPCRRAKRPGGMPRRFRKAVLKALADS